MQAIPALACPYELSNSLLHLALRCGIPAWASERARTRLRVRMRVM